MADVKVFLFGNDADPVFLTRRDEEQSDTGPLLLNTLVLPRGETLSLASALEVDRALVTEPSAGSGNFVFLPFGDVGLTLEAELVFAATGSFFGVRLQAEAGVAARLTLRLPPVNGGARDVPFAELEVCGRVEVNAGAADFTTDPLCFRVTVDDLPSSPAALKLPSLHLALPNIGFNLPHLPLAWNFPKLPPLPWRLPALSLSRGSFPLTVSWKSATIKPAPDRVTLDIEQLRVGTEFGAIEGDLHLVLSGGRVNAAESFFHLYHPDFGNRVLVPISEWHFDEQCAALKWTEPELNAWLRLLSPELAARTQVSAGTSVTLRLMRGGKGLDEIRLDWETGASKTTIDLPGFDITPPSIQMYSLVVRREADERERLTLLATIKVDEQQQEGDIPDGADDPDEQGDDDIDGDVFKPADVSNLAFTATSDFTLARPGQRKLHRDEAAASDPNNKPLITFTATPKNNLSLVLFDLSLSGGGGDISFFKQLDHAVRPVVFDQGAARVCEPTDCNPVSLSPNDWEVDIKINKDATKEFVLPFLKKDKEPGVLENLSQKLGIKTGTLLSLDFATHQIKCRLDIEVALGGMSVDTEVVMTFDWERFAFGVDDLEGFRFKGKETPPGEFLGLTWVFRPAPDGVLFRLVTKDDDFQLKQEPGSTLFVEFSRATSHDQPIVFTLSDFRLTPGGVSVNGRVADSPARLTGINEQFRFTEGSFQIRDNHLTDFSISGAGPLPPALVGNAVASISLQFGQRDGRLELVAGAAQLRGTKLLKCQGTRFQFSVDGIGLKFVNDGHYHLYFTITATARFVPFDTDDQSGPLAWLPAIELQLVECPLTGDASVIRKHIKFLIDLPKKKTFDFLGCFKMELRGIGFVPQADEFSGDPAMELSGQVKFADGDGDVIDARIDFHSLFIGLPAPGDIVPRIHLKDLGVKVRTGSAFELEGTVDFLDREEIEQGIIASGFTGEGSLSIQGLPTMAASFSFIRVSRDGGRTWVRAWFIYLEARKLSLLIPIIKIYMREIGLGFGYRYTLASIKAADETEDPRELIKLLTKLSRTQGQLSRRDQWRVDLEEPGQDARWTVVLRALLSQASAAGGPIDWNSAAEKDLSCTFVMDVVIALRNDLTFLMTGRAWLNTNYNDFLTDVRGLQTKPLLSGFVLLSPRRKRLLAHLASNPGAEFGDHPPLPGFIKQALAESTFSATLLIEPGLLHYELGWPNMLRWHSKLGPLDAEFRGGTIFRVSRSELVIGNSFLARGSLELSAEVDLGIVGARLSAVANVAYGARYIGVIGFEAPLARSALYGAVGVEINVSVQIDFWLRIKIGFVKITLRFGFSFAINLTAFLEVGLTAGDLVGARGTATVSLNIMGRGLRFGIHVGINESAVDAARRITSQFLNVGLEATEVEPIPGTQNGGANALSAPVSQPKDGDADNANAADDASDSSKESAAKTAASQPVATVATAKADEEVHLFEVPNYTLFSIPFKEKGGKESRYFVLLPGAPKTGKEGGSAANAERGFLPVPPDGVVVVNDFKWEMPATGNVKVYHFNPNPTDEAKPWTEASGTVEWQVKWGQPLGDHKVIDPETKESVTGGQQQAMTVKSLLTHAFITELKDGTNGDDLDSYVPVADPVDVSASDDVLEDERVHNPSDDAFEAAVRGAVGQFESSPNFKHDDRSEYDSSLKDAFSPDTSIYSQTGQLTPDQRRDAERTQQAVEMRSLIVKQLIEALQEYAALAGGNEENLPASDKAKVKEIIDNSLAFQMGLVFKTMGGTPDWLVRPGKAGQITQRRTAKESQPQAVPAGDERFVKPFNTSETSFDTSSPQFRRIKHCADANTIAITWELFWPADKEWKYEAETAPAQKDPEHHLRHYLVCRRPLAGDEREVEFTVKHTEVLHRPGDSDVVRRLRPRFQIVDHFNHETAEDQAALPPEGKSYLYTIIPIDVAGGTSPRPLNVISTRRPNAPPAVPADGELLVKYQLDKIDPPNDKATALRPESVVVTWTQPAPPADGPHVPVAETRVIFRKEKTLPAGSYALDAEAAGGRASGLPTSNARPLRTDIVVRLSKTAHTRNKFESGNITAALEKRGVFPQDGWRPEAWRVFIQTVSDTGVESALAPVAVVLQFRAKPDADPSHTEERRPPQLEWLAKPVRFKALPPVDESADDGFARVPMPVAVGGEPVGKLKADSDFTKLVSYEPHPLGLRCLRFEWNQGPSRAGSYPLELHAGYRLYEFDLDEHTAGLLDAPPSDFWDHLRRAQEMEILVAEGLLLTPSDTLATQKWEAWYPSLVRRRRLRELQKKQESAPPQKQKNGSDAQQLTTGIPPKQSEARLSPWYTWRDSYLAWPEDASLRQPEGTEATASEVTGLMQIRAGENKIISTREGRDAFKAGQNFSNFKQPRYVRISGAKSPGNNGVKRLVSVNVSTTETGPQTEIKTELTFEDGSFDVDEPIAGEAVVNGQTLTDEGRVVSGKMKIHKFEVKGEITQWRITNDDGKLTAFSPGQSVRISGAGLPVEGVVRKVVTPHKVEKDTDALQRENELSFDEKAFTSEFEGKLTVDAVTLTVDGTPFRSLHPLLEKLCEEIGRRTITVGSKRVELAPDVAPRQPEQPNDLNAVLKATAPDIDPYGWNILRRMGLSITFTLRDSRTGDLPQLDPLTDKPEQVTRDIQTALRDILRPYMNEGDYAPHLHVEYLFQPAKSMRLENEPAASSEGDLLALIQLSLRPAVRQAFGYRRVEIGTGKGGKRILLTLKTGAAPCTFVEQTGVAAPIELTAAQEFTKEVLLPASGMAVLLIRSLKPEGVIVNAVAIKDPGDDPKAPPDTIITSSQPLHPTDWPVVVFAAPPAPWPQELEFFLLPADVDELLNGLPKETPADLKSTAEGLLRGLVQNALTGLAELSQKLTGTAKDQIDGLLSRLRVKLAGDAVWQVASEVKAAWAGFRRYLLRMNPAEAANPDDPKIEFPKDDNGIAALLLWLERFFEASGDDRRSDEDPNAKGTLPGPWVAAAYPRAASPVGVAPDAAGRLKFYQPVEDQWGHVSRYFIVPHGRYDRLWQALAQSSALFPPEDVRSNNLLVIHNLESLRTLDPPEGGMDVVLDRVKSVAAPLVLFSGRLDSKSTPAEVPPPGKVWEVIVAKHPEQSLIERNRTLARHLSYRHVAYTLLRRFAFAGHLKELYKLLKSQYDQLELKVELAENVFPEEGDPFDEYSEPEQIANPEQPSADELRTLEIAERIGVFGKDALVLQWNALPYFYEHRLLLVAQTSACVSPVSDIVQKDFEYQSPQPFAAAEGLLFEETEGPKQNEGRSLLLLIELRSFWSCLPKEARERWPSERWRSDEEDDEPSPADDAMTTGTHTRKLSSLPDTEVIYQIVMRRPSGLVETISELFFEAEPKPGTSPSPPKWKGYKVRPFNQHFTTQVGRIRVPETAPPRPPRPLQLEASLSLDTVVALVRSPQSPITFRGDFTRAALNSLLFKSIEEFQVVPNRPGADASPTDINRFLRRWYAVRAVTHDDVHLPESLSDKVDFFDPDPAGTVVIIWKGAATILLLAELEKWAAANTPPLAQLIRDIRQKVAAATGEITVITPAPKKPTALPDTLRQNVLVGKRLLRVRDTLDDAEQAALLLLYPEGSPDQASLKRLINDLKDRQTLEQFLDSWASEQPISSRAAFPDFASFKDKPSDAAGSPEHGRATFLDFASLNERIDFPAPMSCTLALNAKLIEDGDKKRWMFLTADERQTLRKRAAISDTSFGLALRSLLEQEAVADLPEPVGGEPAPTLFAEAGVGFEQLAEIADKSRFELPDKTPGMLVWKGLMGDEQRAVLGRWAEVSSFGRTFAALCEAADQLEINTQFDNTQPFPTSLPSLLKRRLEINAPAIKWRRLQLAVDEEEALVALSQDASFGQSFRDAIKKIHDMLCDGARIEVAVREPDWSARPKQGSELPQQLLVGNGRLRFHGWMSRRDEAHKLLTQPGLGAPDREAVKRLFRDSLRAGLDGGTLEIRAQRGSASSLIGELGVFTEED